MGGGGSDTKSNPNNATDASGNTIIAPNQANFDSKQIESFSNTEHAKQLGYTPEQVKALLSNTYQGASGSYSFPGNGTYTQIDNLANAFTSWMSGNAQTQKNWENYANAANANEGGEGDQTITEGAAKSQRQTLLGSLADPNSVTTPSAALGSMGVVMKNGRALAPGGVK